MSVVIDGRKFSHRSTCRICAKKTWDIIRTRTCGTIVCIMKDYVGHTPPLGSGVESLLPEGFGEGWQGGTIRIPYLNGEGRG